MVQLLILNQNLEQKKINNGKRATLFIRKPEDDSIPKEAKPGDMLLGHVHYYKVNKDNPDRKVRGYPINYLVPPSKPQSPSSPSDDDDSKTTEILFLDSKVQFLSKLLSDKKRRAEIPKFIDQLFKENSKYLPILDLQLKYLDQPSDRMNQLDSIITAADEIISSIDKISLAAHYGTKIPDSEDPVLIKTRKEMDKQKAFLINALYVKANAMMDKPNTTALIDAINAFKTWGDIEDAKYNSLEINFLNTQALYGSALKIVMKNLDSTSERKMFDLQIELLKKLQWTHWINFYKNWSIIKFPPSFAIN